MKFVASRLHQEFVSVYDVMMFYQVPGYQGYRDLQILLLDSVDSAALSRDSKIGSHWYWAEPGFADNSDINKTIEQPLSKN